jgi:hypothetical protein
MRGPSYAGVRASQEVVNQPAVEIFHSAMDELAVRRPPPRSSHRFAFDASNRYPPRALHPLLCVILVGHDCAVVDVAV